MEKEDFTMKMKIFSKKRGIKQNDLAKQLGVSHTVVSNVVNGRDRLGTQSAVRWGEILGIDPLWLMTQGEQGTAPDEVNSDVKKKPPHLSQARRPIQTLLTFSFSSTITTIYNHIVMRKTLHLLVQN